jgi:hypothetical protein
MVLSVFQVDLIWVILWVALQERRNPENNRKVLKRPNSPGQWQRPARVGLQGLATMNEVEEVIFRMAHSYGRSQGRGGSKATLYHPL